MAPTAGTGERPRIPLITAALCAPLTGINRRWPRVLHAVEMDEIVRAWPDGTATAPCGATRLRLLASDGVAVEWPPRVAGLEPTFERCRSCWEATGSRRPRSTFKRAAA